MAYGLSPRVGSESAARSAASSKQVRANQTVAEPWEPCYRAANSAYCGEKLVCHARFWCSKAGRAEVLAVSNKPDGGEGVARVAGHGRDTPVTSEADGSTPE